MRNGLSDEEGDAAVKRIVDEEGDIFRIYLDNHKPPIPTIAAGLALTKPDGTPLDRKNLSSILSSLGQNPEAVTATGRGAGYRLVDNLRNSLNRFKAGDNSDGYEAWYPGIHFKNPPPLGINLLPGQSLQATKSRVYDAAGVIRGRLGTDSSGAYNFDKLAGEEKGALIDAYHSSPSFIGENLVHALQQQDVPGWRDNVRFELDANVKSPNNRRRHEGNSFIAVDPPSSLLNSDSYLQSPVGDLFSSDQERNAFLDSLQRKIDDGMASQAPSASAGKGGAVVP